MLDRSNIDPKGDKILSVMLGKMIWFIAKNITNYRNTCTLSKLYFVNGALHFTGQTIRNIDLNILKSNQFIL